MHPGCSVQRGSGADGAEDVSEVSMYTLSRFRVNTMRQARVINVMILHLT